MATCRCPADKGHRCVGGHSCRGQLSGNRGQTLHPHQHDLRARSRGDRLIVDSGCFFVRLLVSGENRQHRVARTVRDRNSGVGGAADRGSDPGNDLEAKSGGCKFRRLFSSPAEEERVSSLQTHDPFSLAGKLHQKGIGLFLLESVPPRRLAGVDFFSGSGCKSQKLRIAQVIVDHHIGHLETLLCAKRQKPRITGTGSHKVADASRLLDGGQLFLRWFRCCGGSFFHHERSWSAIILETSAGLEAVACAVIGADSG